MISKKLGDKVVRDLSALGAMPFYLFLIVFVFLLGFDKLAYWLLAGFILSYVITVLIRLIYYKNRPKKEGYKNILEKIDASSFPSLHAWRVVMMFCFFNLYFSIFYLSVLFFVIAYFVSFSRVYLKKHYISDVLGGFVLGLISSLVIVWVI